jgi:malonyl-CoA O-methyltransferase
VTEPATLDKRQVRNAFGRAAGTYDGAAQLQRDIADQLAERLDIVRIAPQSVLDLGCGTGYGSALLARRYPKAQIVALDMAESMLRRARARASGWRRWLSGLLAPPFRPLCADAESLPLGGARLDLVVSNLALQWCDPARVFAEVRRVLRPGGLFLFSTFGPDTLKEMRQAWQSVDSAVHVHDFADMHDLGDLMYGLGFRDPVMDVERHVLYHETVLDALRDLKRIGAHNVARGRARGLMGKRHFAGFRETYETLASGEGRIPVSYEVVYGLAWAPASNTGVRGDSVGIPVHSIGRRK